MNAVAANPQVRTGACSLRELLRGVVSDVQLAQVPDQRIAGLSLDSRQLEANSLFLAVPGLRSHGLDYAAQAARNGASVVLWQPDGNTTPPALPNAYVLALPHLKNFLGTLADRFYAQPSAAMRIAAVTGTNGKTTTAHLIASAAEHCGLRAGYSGTIGYGRVNDLQPSTHTTPDVVAVHRQLAQLRDVNAQVVAMEVSSHALHQARIDAVRVDTAVFTNLSRDHLDYHGSMQAYAAAKASLFEVKGVRHHVINADDALGQVLLKQKTSAIDTTAYTCGSSMLTPTAAQKFIQARSVYLSATGLELELVGSHGNASLRSPLLGRFNAENLLAALAVLLGWDIPLTQAVQALAQVSPPPGRMELLKGAGKRAVVDYAHTPDALEKALTVLKQHCLGRLICVFGCGGDRDPGKRAVMGGIAARLADRVILTDDNPRSEDPDKIIAAIKSGAANFPFIVERHRARAIEQALHDAEADDIVLIAGKGHEDYQIIGADVRHFSDREVVHAVLERAT